MQLGYSGTEITGMPALLVMLVLGFLAYGWPAMIISKRAHGSAWPGILMSIPFINIIAIWVFAFSRWPKTDGKRSE